MEGQEPRLKVLALVGLVRPAVRVERAPVNELGNVFDEDAFDVQFGQPVVNGPGVHPALVVDRLPAPGAGVELALGAGHEQVEAPLLDHGLGVHDADILDQVAGRRVIGRVGGDGRVPVVDGDQVHGPADLGDGLLRSGGRAAGPAEQVGDQVGVGHCATSLQSTFRRS